MRQAMRLPYKPETARQIVVGQAHRLPTLDVITIFIVAAPPNVWFRLRPAGRRIFPGFLSSERRPVEEGEVRIHRLDPAIRGEVGLIDRVPVAQKAAQAEMLAFVRAQAEVFIETRAPG